MAGDTAPKLTYYKSPHKVKVWFVAFRMTNPDDQNQRRKFQYRADINSFEHENERIVQGNQLAQVLAERLKDGWNPFNESPGQFLIRQQGGFVNRPKTIGECLKECYDLKYKQLTSKDAHRTYKYIYEHFKKWLEKQFLDKLKPSQFTVTHAMAYGDHLINEGKKGRGFNNYRTVMKVFFNMLVNRDIIEKNPFSRLAPAKTTEAEIVPFQDAELKVIRKHLKEHDYNLYVFTQFVFYCLLRPIEVLKLQVKHIDLTRNKINLPAAASKNRRSRSCNIPPALRNIISEWLKYENINDYLFGKGMAIGPIPIASRNQVTERHKEVLKELEFDSKISLYSYKYSGVIASYLAGISMEEIRIQAGHSSIEITQIYMQKLGLLKPSSFGIVDY